MKAAPHRWESHIRPRQTSLHHHNALIANYSPASITHGVSSMMLQRKRVFIHVLLQARLCSATWDGGLSILANKHSNQMQDLKRPERISQRFLVKLDSSSYKKVSKSFTETSGLKNKSKADSEFLALPPSFTVGIIFLIKRRSIFKPDVTAAHLFWLVSPRNVCLNNHQDGFWLKWDEPSCSLLTAGGGDSRLGTFPWMPFLASVCLMGMNADLEWGLQFFWCFPRFLCDLDESSSHS